MVGILWRILDPYFGQVLVFDAHGNLIHFDAGIFAKRGHRHIALINLFLFSAEKILLVISLLDVVLDLFDILLASVVQVEPGQHHRTAIVFDMRLVSVCILIFVLLAKLLSFGKLALVAFDAQIDSYFAVRVAQLVIDAVAEEFPDRVPVVKFDRFVQCTVVVGTALRIDVDMIVQQILQQLLVLILHRIVQRSVALLVNRLVDAAGIRVMQDCNRCKVAFLNGVCPVLISDLGVRDWLVIRGATTLTRRASGTHQ
mmetsp:Transcript_782/g.1498  ORF Transcript_782/g.1498 Transcript_782/m.1498 type:complete len:256 (-) Transcript_782:582-1349(-)